MKVVLLKDDKRYGKKGDIIDVNDGFANNYLLPNKIVAIANNTNLNFSKQLKESEKFKQETALSEAQEIANKIKDITLDIAVKVGDNGKIFGSVTAKEISESLASKGIDVDRRKFEIKNPIKQIGLYEVAIKLHTKVVAKLKVNVVSQ